MNGKTAYCLFAAVFVLFLSVCVYTDFKEGKIKNFMPVLITALAVWYRGGILGCSFPYLSLSGALIPFLVLFPVFLIRGIGAGDVKLLMACGAAAGGEHIWKIMFAAFFLGGLEGLIAWRAQKEKAHKVHMALPAAVGACLWLGGIL